MLKNSHVSGYMPAQQPPMRFRFEFGESKIPHPEKAYKGGEDACFADDNIIVVADGVGGWADRGVDPSLYSNKLCQLIRDNFYRNPYFYIADPRQLLVDSVAANVEVGSATVTVLTLEPTTGILRSAYLGDSVFSIYRATPYHGYIE
jgi:protein phosphatase PTC7